MNDSTETPTPAPVATETLVAAGFTSGDVVASENPTTPSVAASTEPVSNGETGNGSTPVETGVVTGEAEIVGESTSADVSAEKSVAHEQSSNESLSSDSLKPVPTSPEPSPAPEAPAHSGKLIPGVGQPDHEGYFARLKDVAKGVEVEIVDDVKELEQKLKNFSSEMSYAVDRFRKEFNL